MKQWHLIPLTMLLVLGMALPMAVPAGAQTVPPAPAPPTTVMAVPGDHSATIAWNAPVIPWPYQLAGYQINVYQNGQPAYPFHVAVPAGSTKATVTGLTNGLAYTFRMQVKLRTITTPSLESAWSSESVQPAPVAPAGPVVPPAPALPAAPTQLDAHAASGTVLLAWTAPPATDSAVVQYQVNVYLKDKNGAFGKVTNAAMPYPSATLAYARVTQLDGTQTYRFTVQARNAAGWGPESAPSVAVVPSATVPGNPTITSVVPGDGSVTVSWAGPYISGIDHYLVTVTRVGGDVVAFSDGKPSPVTITGLTNGTAYTVDVRAVDTQHMMSKAASAYFVPAAPVQPRAPVGLQAQPDNQQVTLTWSNPVPNPNAPIHHYAVVVYQPPAVSGQSPVVVLQSEPVYATSITASGLVNGWTYTAEVRSVSTAGARSAPAMASFVVATVPTAPRGVLVAMGIGQANVTWTMPASNGGSAITGYVVTATTGVASEARTVNAPAGSTSATVTNLVPGKAYTFTVAAVNAMGQGPASQPTVPILVANVPGAPHNLTVVAGDQSVQARWDAPASDGGSAITGYQVTAWDGVHTATAAVVGAGTASVMLTGLTNGVTYTVSVIAVNAVGPSSPASASAMPRNTAPTLQVPAAMTVHHGDQVTGAVTVTDPDAADHISITASGLPNGVTFTDLGNGSGTFKGNAEVPVGAYTLTFTASDGHHTPVSASTTLTVTHEQVSIRPLTPASMSVVLKKAGQTKALSVAVSASVREVTESAAYPDVNESATITYTLTVVDTGKVFSGTVRTSGGIEPVVTSKYTFHNIPIGVYHLKISVGGNYYHGQSEAMLMVSNVHQISTVKGLGTVNVPGSSMTSSFQINAKRLAGGALTGSILYVQHESTGNHTLKSGRITGVVVKNNRAYVQGMANLDGVGGHQFVATLVDRHQLGMNDGFGLQVIDNAYAPMPHFTFAPVNLDEGAARVTAR